jgi:hypothetical protein
VANNFGEALPEASCLILSMTKASDSTVLSTAEIMVPANSTTIAIPYALQGAPGAYEISALDKRTGYHIQNSPSIVLIAGPSRFPSLFPLLAIASSFPM